MAKNDEKVPVLDIRSDRDSDREDVAKTGGGQPNVLTGGRDPLAQRTLHVEDVVRAESSWKEEEVPVSSFDEINDKAIRDLMAITGRNVSELALRRGGEVVNGQMTLYAVHDLKRKVLVLGGAKVPEGCWVPANHLPMALLRSLEETDEERRAREKREEEARRS